ncbi:TetR/AcrR family transcriptional regulator [Sphingobium aromaticivastans]|uniref:TetR/AcrR family transcriptional regulator n=1 Tax=Sphingobium aromaticivastans TaxID=1778665 RepID=UPI0030175602
MTMTARPPQPSSAKAGRGRPRDAEVDENILAAARQLLAEGGFDAMSFEAVAQLAGVTRPTIYRRWPTKAHLANEIANGGGRTIADIIESQGLRAQLLAFVTLLMAQYRRPETSAANAGLMVSFRSAPELRDELHTPLEKQARKDLAAILDKGKALGLIAASVDADIVFDIAVGAVIFRAMFSSLPARKGLADAICDIIQNGIAVGTPTS